MENITFSPDELEIAFRYSTMRPGPEGKPGFRTPVSVSENMRRFVSGEAPVWMPYGEYRVFGPEIIPDDVARGKVFEENPTDVNQPGKYTLVEAFPYPAGGADAFFAALYEGSRKRCQ